MGYMRDKKRKKLIYLIKKKKGNKLIFYGQIERRLQVVPGMFLGKQHTAQVMQNRIQYDTFLKDHLFNNSNKNSEEKK